MGIPMFDREAVCALIAKRNAHSAYLANDMAVLVFTVLRGGVAGRGGSRLRSTIRVRLLPFQSIPCT